MDRATQQKEMETATEVAGERRAGVRSSRWLNLLFLVLGLSFVCILTFLMQPGIEEKRETPITFLVERGDLDVFVTEQGTLESAENTEIKCQVRGKNTITWVVESGEIVKKGDELLRLDTLALEETITERIKYAYLTRASAERLKAAVVSAELEIKEYEFGTFKSQLMGLEKDLAIAKINWNSARNQLEFREMMELRGFSNSNDVNQSRILAKQHEQQVQKIETDIEVLKKFTRREEVTRLEGNLAALRANYEAESERATADANRRDRAMEELQHCRVYAPRDGLVIHPSAAQWTGAPDIEEGATVHKTQVMLLMPDLEKMQVKVGIHESMVDRVRPGMEAIVSLTNSEIQCKVHSVASVTRPAGWWTGNVVKYDTIVKMPENTPGLKPGMSAEVRIVLGRFNDVIRIPVAAIIQTDEGEFCWVRAGERFEKRKIEIAGSNDVFVVVDRGLEVGEEVLLNPMSEVEAASGAESVAKSSNALARHASTMLAETQRRGIRQ